MSDLENQFIEDSFENYIKHVFSKVNLSNDQKAELRKAFFSGACVIFDVFEKLSTECRIQQLADFYKHTRKEVNRFDNEQSALYEEMIKDNLNG